MSKRYTLSKEDIVKILKVLAYSGASAIVASLIVIVGNIDVPVQWAFLPTIINTLLVALQKFLTDSQGKLGVAME